MHSLRDWLYKEVIFNLMSFGPNLEEKMQSRACN